MHSVRVCARVCTQSTQSTHSTAVMIKPGTTQTPPLDRGAAQQGAAAAGRGPPVLGGAAVCAGQQLARLLREVVEHLDAPRTHLN